MGSAMNTNPNYKGGDINDLIGQSNFMTNNFVNISLKNKGQAYPDAIEYKRSGLFVQTFQEFIAWDKNNGFKIKTPFNAIFVFDEKGRKSLDFGGLTTEPFGKNGIYQDKLLKMELYTRTIHILVRFVKFGITLHKVILIKFGKIFRQMPE